MSVFWRSSAPAVAALLVVALVGIACAAGAGEPTENGVTATEGEVADAAPREPVRLTVAARPLAIAGPRTRIELPQLAGEATVGLADRAADGRCVALLVHDLAAEAPPGVLFHLYLTGTAGGAAELTPEDARFVGSINFYGAVPRRPGFQRFALDGALAELRRRGELAGDATPELVVVAEGPVAPGSSPVLGRLELVVEPCRRDG